MMTIILWNELKSVQLARAVFIRRLCSLMIVEVRTYMNKLQCEIVITLSCWGELKWNRTYLRITVIALEHCDLRTELRKVYFQIGIN